VKKEVSGVSLMVAHGVPTSTTMALPHGPAGVVEARRRLRTDLYAQAVPEPVIDDAVLILTELLSNSCRHARPLGGHVSGCASGHGSSHAGGHGDSGEQEHGSGGGDGGSGHCGAGDTRQAGVQAPARLLACGASVGGQAQDHGIRAAWSVDADGLLVLEVTDGGGPTRPRPASPSLTAHGGRGLGIVGSLALRWGVRDAPGEVTVWAVLPAHGRQARRDNPPATITTLPRAIPLDLPLDLAESLDDIS
jgi:two-component sensor histidine kinase